MFTLATLIGLGALGAYTGGMLLTFAFLVGDGVVRRRGTLPGLLQLVVVFWREWGVCLITALTYPLGWLPQRPHHHDPEGGPPILLVHGFLMNRSCMFPIAWRLRRRGYNNVRTVNLWPPFASMSVSGPRLAADVRALSRACGGEPVTVVAHSMGGVVTRWCLAAEPELPVRALIAIAAPHRGSRTAWFSHGDNAREMRPGSALLRRLEVLPPVPLTSIVTRADNIVIPSDSAHWGHRVVVNSNWAHLGLLYAEAPFALVVAELPPLQAVASSAPPSRVRAV